MTDPHPPGSAPGSVADEAARLLDALGAWAHRDTGDHTHDPYAGAGRSAAEPTDEPATEAAADPAPEPAADHSPGRCDACGAETGTGRAASCRVCPVCQAITVLRAVRPETVDRLADLAVAVASGLRDLAEAGRRAGDGEPDRAGGADAPASGASASGRARGRSGEDVQDIPVVDDDLPWTPGGQHEQDAQTTQTTPARAGAATRKGS